MNINKIKYSIQLNIEDHSMILTQDSFSSTIYVDLVDRLNIFTEPHDFKITLELHNPTKIFQHKGFLDNNEPNWQPITLDVEARAGLENTIQKAQDRLNTYDAVKNLEEADRRFQASMY
mgnify:CR=1 FL=1